MKTIIHYLLQFTGIILAADFVTGLFHWLEDAYAREDTPLVGEIIAKPNMVHHHYPGAMARHSWWKTSRELLIASAILVGLAALLGHFCWQVLLFSLLLGNANEVHKWAHRTGAENGPFIRLLQRLRLVQDARHHSRHHSGAKDSHYCILTVFLNPLLDKIHFWAGMEKALDFVLGWKRRLDSSVPGSGPVPAWILQMRNNPAPLR